MKKNYAVFGLGRYGMAVATELASCGAEVLAVDIDQEIVNEAASVLPYCKCADVTDPNVIRQLGIASIDVVVVSMASDLESSVMATMLCKEAGVETVVAKCSGEMECRILSKVGADMVIFPEHDSGIRLAKNLLSSGFVDILDLTDEVSMVELEVNKDWVGKSLKQLNLRQKYQINIVAIRQGEKVIINIDPDMPIEKTMRLIIIADKTKLKKL